MSRAKRIVAIVGMMALAVVAMACGNGEAATGADVEAEGTSPTQNVQKVEQTTAPETTLVAPAKVDVVRSSAGPATAAVQIGGSQSGIWVTGLGRISLEPDMVLLNVGVETMGETVAAARDEAATAMAAIVQAVRARGLEEKDIQTRSFSIYPRYEFAEVTLGGTRTRQQVLVGYTVSNTAVVKIRDMDSVGTIIDEVADAGGDATRINGIDFTVEDTKPYMDRLREDAVNDATAKAEQFASLTGVSVGGLTYISELGGRAPVLQDFAQVKSFALAEAAAPTSISGGQLELSLSVQAVFAIE